MPGPIFTEEQEEQIAEVQCSHLERDTRATVPIEVALDIGDDKILVVCPLCWRVIQSRVLSAHLEGLGRTIGQTIGQAIIKDGATNIIARRQGP